MNRIIADRVHDLLKKKLTEKAKKIELENWLVIDNAIKKLIASKPAYKKIKKLWDQEEMLYKETGRHEKKYIENAQLLKKELEGNKDIKKFIDAYNDWNFRIPSFYRQEHYQGKSGAAPFEGFLRKYVRDMVLSSNQEWVEATKFLQDYDFQFSIIRSAKDVQTMFQLLEDKFGFSMVISDLEKS